MSIISTPGLTLVKLDDNTGTLIVQGSTGNTNNLMEFRTPGDRRPQPYISGSYSIFNGSPSSVKTYIDKDGILSVNDDDSYGFPSGVVFKTKNYSFETFGPQFYFRTGYSSPTWIFQGSGMPSFLSLNSGGISSYLETPWISDATTKKALVVKGLASQTADLQQWQNSAGTAVAGIGAGGAAFFGRGTAFASTVLSISTAAASNIGLIIQGASSQSANLQEWQNSTGTILTKIDSNGALSVTNAANVVNATTVYNAAGTPVFNVDTTTTAVNLGGGLSGVANNYGSTWGYDSSVNAGYITFTTGALGGDSLAIRRTNHIASGDYTISSLGNMRFSTASGKNFNFNNGSIGIATTAIGTNNKLIINPYSTVDNLATVQINTNATTNKGLVVQGVSNQTASIQEWQDAAGNVVGKFYPYNPGGDYVLYLNGDGNGPGSYSSIIIGGRWIRNEQRTAISKFGVNTGEWHLASNPDTSAIAITDNQVGVFANSTSLTTFTVQAVASQTANLTEWKNSSGTILARVGGDGTFVVGNSVFDYYGNLYIRDAGYYSANVNIKTDSAATTGIVIRGTASQTADLQQWQNSAGTTLAAVSSGGSLYGTGIYASYLMQVISGASSQVALTVKGTTSQTASLQEWQNSSGSVLSSISSSGLLDLSAVNGTWPTLLTSNIGDKIGLWTSGAATSFGFGIQASRTVAFVPSGSGFSVRKAVASGDKSSGTDAVVLFETGAITQTLSSASVKGLVIKGASSQTANLQEWQDSSGTVLAKIDSNGFFTNTYGANLSTTHVSPIGGVSVFIGGQLGAIANTILKNSSGATYDFIQFRNSSDTTLAKLDANGNFSAVSKSFDIPHPTKDEMRLRYASLEGPENGVYIRATIDSDIIELPDYWVGLVHKNSITAHLTPFGSKQDIYIEKIEDNKIYIGGNIEKAFLVVYAERKDIDRLTVEYNDPSLPGRPRL